MRIKKKIFLFCTIFTSLIVSNAYSDRLENDHSWEPECEDCVDCRFGPNGALSLWGRTFSEDLARGKNFEIDDIYA